MIDGTALMRFCLIKLLMDYKSLSYQNLTDDCEFSAASSNLNFPLRMAEYEFTGAFLVLDQYFLRKLVSLFQNHEREKQRKESLALMF